MTKTTSQDMPLASNPLERAAHRRTDSAWLSAAEASQNALYFLMADGSPIVETQGKAAGNLFWHGPEARAFGPPGVPPIFMGEDKQGAPVFALAVPESLQMRGTVMDGIAEIGDIRTSLGALSPLEANLVSTARSLLMWHESHGFCAKCGHASTTHEAGWKRICVTCGTEHFPRTDPVAIMLAVRGDYCLLGRGPGWPEGFVSALAGFVEPGESVEQAAARELMEEAGIKAHAASAEYLFCQPWPFPSSLMVGLLLQAESEEITLDKNELDDAKWYSREDVQKILAGTHAHIFCPPKQAIAYHIMKVWSERKS